ncbi:hypothetical protein BJX64DRAFT_283947 [Aspergillus heterothallicus]
MATISTAIRTSLRKLSEIASSDALIALSDQVPIYKWTDELGRLRVWAANIGAHQADQSSLDYRLRDASHIKNQVMAVLSGLNDLLIDIDELLHESEVGESASQKSEGQESCCQLEDQVSDETEIQAIYTSLVHIVSNLYQLSMIIRQPAPHDRIVARDKPDIQAFKFFDRQHISDKYNVLEEFLIDRLSMAMSKQRALLKYRERHHEKLSRGLEQADDSKSTYQLSETTATAFNDVGLFHDTDRGSEGSVTSYAQSQFAGDGGLKVPEPPEGWDDESPVQCPYCWYIVVIKDRREWARHVFHDVMPYVCLDSRCPTPNLLYKSRRQWYNHIQIVHSPTNIVGTSCRCVICGQEGIAPGRLEKHLGRHLEDMALFVLYSSTINDPTREIEGMDLDDVQDIVSVSDEEMMDPVAHTDNLPSQDTEVKESSPDLPDGPSIGQVSNLVFILSKRVLT